MARLDTEAGAHRVQRIPKSVSRVHTSTVTISVLRENLAHEGSAPFLRRKPRDFRVEWFNGTTKAGGQHHQKNATCCRRTHLPTNITRTAQTRSRENSQQLAMSALNADLDRLMGAANAEAANCLRRAHVGGGGRGEEKRRTWRFQEDTVSDHVTGKRARATDVLGGRFELLWA